jgi:hypothetical protein
MAKETLERRLAKLNVLESAIIRGEDSAEDARWGQARYVAELIDSGVSQSEIARGWINGRTDRPYARQHVIFCDRIWRRWGVSELTARPDWTSAYYTVQQKSDEIISENDRKQQWSEAHEARAPKSEGSAEELIKNLIKGDAAICAQVYEGLRHHELHRMPPPTRVERREGVTHVEENVIGPIKRAMAPITKLELVVDLESATALLDEMIEDGALDPASMEQIEAANQKWQASLEVARAMTEERNVR